MRETLPNIFIKWNGIIDGITTKLMEEQNNN